MLVLALLGGLIGAAAWYRDLWMPLLRPTVGEPSTAAADVAQPAPEAKVLELSPQARLNLKLVSRPAKVSTYWR
ncbi:hypothetical protein EBR04_07550, partial [bacterium]|nr:hypothetical protein [bacterium]